MVKITKSLSVGLTTACFSTMLFMSSCSKEDALIPTPQSDVNQSSNLREAGGGILAVEYITSTDGPTGHSSPNNWDFPFFNPDDSYSYESENATSNLTAFAGDPLKKWMKPLPSPSTGSGNIITIGNDPNRMESADTDIKNLIIGKKYRFTYSVSTTRMNYSSIANEAVVTLYSNGLDEHFITDTTNFGNKESQWVTKSIEFVAKYKSYHIKFSGVNNLSFNYTNIHVGKNAIKPIN